MAKKNGQIPSENEVAARLKYFCQKIGVEYKASHSGRRYYATSMINDNIPITEVSNDLSHKRPSTTINFYLMCIDEDNVKVMKKKNKVQKKKFENLATSGNTPNL